MCVYLHILFGPSNNTIFLQKSVLGVVLAYMLNCICCICIDMCVYLCSMSICIHVCACFFSLCIYIYLHSFVNIYINIYIFFIIYIYIHLYIYIYIYSCVYIYICSYLRNVYVYICRSSVYQCCYFFVFKVINPQNGPRASPAGGPVGEDAEDLCR